MLHALQKTDGEDRQGFSLLFHSEDQEFNISRADGFREVAEIVKPHIGEDGIQDMHANVAAIKKPSVASVETLKASHQILSQQPFNRPFHPLAREVVEYAKQIDSNVLSVKENV